MQGGRHTLCHPNHVQLAHEGIATEIAGSIKRSFHNAFDRAKPPTAAESALERRQNAAAMPATSCRALETGVLHPVAEIERLAGQWTEPASGRQRLTIHHDSSYDLHSTVEGERSQIVAQGRVWVTADGLHLEDWGGSNACFGAQSHAVSSKGGLTTQPITGSCAQPESIHATARTWRKQ